MCIIQSSLLHNGKKLVDTKVINCIEAIIAVLMEWTACPTTTQNKPDLIPYSSITEKVDLVGELNPRPQASLYRYVKWQRMKENLSIIYCVYQAT
jgi:hypothetical protein